MLSQGDRSWILERTNFLFRNPLFPMDEAPCLSSASSAGQLCYIIVLSHSFLPVTFKINRLEILVVRGADRECWGYHPYWEKSNVVPFGFVGKNVFWIQSNSRQWPGERVGLGVRMLILASFSKFSVPLPLSPFSTSLYSIYFFNPLRCSQPQSLVWGCRAARRLLALAYIHVN